MTPGRFRERPALARGTAPALLGRYVASILLLLAAALPLSAPAFAHLTPNSEIQIDFGRNEAVADIIIPQSDYAAASSNRIGDVAAAREFLSRHLRVTSLQGQPWRIRYDLVEFVQIAGPPDLHAAVTLLPPAGVTARALELHWSAVIDRNPNHFAIVLARSDFGKAQFGAEAVPEVLGTFQGNRQALRIDRGGSSYWRGFVGSVQLGMHHIIEGHDHLLFLITLLLPTLVMASGWRWGDARPISLTLAQFAKVVTAFTVGHSITLVGGAMFDWQLPSRPVEVLIALSILISALHAWRPIFPAREPLVAGLFGLAHGLAFATLIGSFGLGIGEKVLAIFGFNLGIELIQLAIVLLILPSLLLLARTTYYHRFREAGALFAGVAAAAWLAERLSERGNRVSAWFDAFLENGLLLIAALTAAAVAATLIDGKARG